MLCIFFKNTLPLLFETGFLRKSGVHQLPRLATEFSVIQLSPCPTPQSCGTDAPRFYGCLEIRTQVLMLACQTLYILSHLPSSLLSLKKILILENLAILEEQFFLYWVPNTQSQRSTSLPCIICWRYMWRDFHFYQ